MVESKRFAFFKKNKTKGDDQVTETEEGPAGGTTRKSFNPVSMIRRVMVKYRTPRAQPHPQPESLTNNGQAVDSNTVIVTVDSSELNDIGKEVTVIRDIRKGRDRGPGGRKRPSSHISATKVPCDIDSSPHSLLNSSCVGGLSALRVNDGEHGNEADNSHVNSDITLFTADKLGETSEVPNLASSQCNSSYLAV